MQLIRNIDRFPFGIRQPIDRGWCIPASIEVVTKYHMPSSTVTQQHIVDEFVRQTKLAIDSIGLKTITEVLKNDSEFSWADKRYFEDFEFHGSFDELANFAAVCVDKSQPLIISIPVLKAPLHEGKWNGWHMYVIVGYGSNFFRVYDPSPVPVNPLPWHDILKFTIRTNLLSKKKTDATDALLLTPHQT